MTLDDVLRKLARECDKAGGQATWAVSAGMSAAYVSDVLNKRREPGAKVLAALGLEKVVGYRRVRDGSKA